MVKSMMKFWSKKANDGKKANQKKRAFTLVEILIVVAVIGILFVTLVPRIDFAGDKARETGIKTDFRSFELAAEQVLRENAGIGEFCDDDGDAIIAELAGANGINLYLDKAIKFDTSGVCAKADQWNQKYTMQIIESSDGNKNNGAIMFISNGKDSMISGTGGEHLDNYALVVTYYDGQIEAETIGFSSNIDASAIETFEAGDAATMTVDASDKISVTYKK